MIRRSTFKPPLESIPQTLARAAGDWHAADYFIAADTPLQVLTTLLRPDYYCLFLCVEGSLKGAVDDRPVELQPYCLAAIAPGSVISVTEVSPYCKGRFVFFTRDFLLRRNINPTLLEALHVLGAQTGHCVRLNKKKAGLLLQLYALLLKKRKVAESGFQEEIVRTLFYTYIYEAALVFRSNGGQPAPGLNRYEDLLQKFSTLLAEHDRKEHYLKFYADALFITPQYLIHAIKQACGQTPGALIDEALVAEAKLLLMDSSLSLGQIATELRFSELAAFSKFFKKHCGLSPSAFRAQLLQQTPEQADRS